MIQYKPNGKDQFKLQLPEGMRDLLKSLADQNGRSITGEIVYRLRQSLHDTAATTPIDPRAGICVAIVGPSYAIDEQVKTIIGADTAKGEVRGVFVTRRGAVRYVVEHQAEGGGSFCHIYSAANLRPIGTVQP